LEKNKELKYVWRREKKNDSRFFSQLAFSYACCSIFFFFFIWKTWI